MAKRTCNAEALRDFIESRKLSLRPNKRSYILRCPDPACGKSKLYIEKVSGRGVCFHCGEGSKAWADHILSRVTGIPRNELAALLFGDRVRAGTDFFEVDLTDWWQELQAEDEEAIEVVEELPEVLWHPNYRPLGLGTEGERYLTKRGIPFDIATEYGIRYSGLDKRVAFPVIADGVMRGYQARYIRQTEFFNAETGESVVIPKMVTMGQVGGKVLMFQDRVTSDHAILSEGPIDAIKCHLCGGNTAAMGKGYTRLQLDILKRKGVRKLYDALDPDASEDTMRLIRDSHEYEFEMFRMEPPQNSGAEDMGDLSFEAAYDVYRSAPRMRAGQVYIYFKRPF